MRITSEPMARRRLCTLPAAMAIAPASAQEAWPTRALHLIVPYPPGLASATARVVAEAMSRALGQPIVVDSRPGATGAVGAATVARAAPDGHTLLMMTQATHAILPHVLPDLPYDPIRDFVPVGTIAQAPAVLLVNRRSGAGDLSTLLQSARARPGGVSYGTPGVGSSAHLVSEMLAASAGVQLNHIPYRGAGPASTDLAAGVVDLVFDFLPGAIGPVRNGVLRPLAVAAEARAAELPEVPTFAELGLPEVRMDAWFGLAAPAHTPLPRVLRLNAALNESLGSPVVADFLASRGTAPLASTPDEFSRRLVADHARFAQLAARLGLGRR